MEKSDLLADCCPHYRLVVLKLCHYPMNYFIVLNKFALTALHRVIDQWKKLKIIEQVSSLCCANVLSPLSCWLWSLSHRSKEHNHLNCCISVKKWKCVSVGTPSFQSGFIRITKLDEYTHRWILPPWNECVFMVMFYVFVFPISEIK